MTIHFSYEKAKVLQALRYHFITRPELKFMVILVNVFALLSAALFYFKVVGPLAFFIGSTLWFIMMVSIWFFLPAIIYRRTETFRHSFSMSFEAENFSLGTERGSKTWPWAALSTFQESPHFFHLYFDSRSFFLVPKSGCKSIDEVFELRKMLKEKIKKQE